MKYTTKLFLIYLTILRMPVSRSQNPESPCPTVFQYRYDRQVGLYGEVSVLIDPTSVIQMNLQMSIGNAVVGNGKLELAKPKDAASNVLNRRPLLYHLFFPAWTGIPPKITQILVNGNLICSGSKIPINLVPIITTVNLQHTLRINIQQLSSSNTPPDNNFIHINNRQDFSPPRDGASEVRYDYYDRQPPPPRPQATEDFDEFGRPWRSPNGEKNGPPPRPQATEDFDEFGRPWRSPNGGTNRPPPPPPRPQATENVDEFGRPWRAPNVEKNRFNFNPTPPPNRFNFNPSPSVGQNPAEVYRGNPFFRDITTENTPKPNRTPPKPTQAQPPVTKIITKSPSTPDLSFDLSDFDLVSKDSSQPTRPYEDVCGQSITTNHLIYDGHVVPRGAYPWLVAVFLVKTNGLNYICSGSLISNRHVVTAAHCVQTEHKKFRPSELVLILGKLNIQKWIPITGEKIVEPNSIHIHPSYESFTSDADIAVLVLSEPLQFTKYIRPICLWRGDTDLDRIVGHSGTVVGWGKDESGVLMTEEPKQTNLPVVSQEKCLASNYQFHYITSNRTFCAGFRNGTGPCNGDSGGGFIMKWEGKWMLRGIVSLSISETTTKSCDLSNYVVFCDASKYTSWLLSFLK